VRGFIVGMQPAMTSWAPTDWNKKKGWGRGVGARWGISFVIPRGEGKRPTEGSGPHEWKP
jgi:hypothetical protein